MSDLYRDVILDHWKHPHNFGTLDHPTCDVSEANPLCGDDIRLQVIEKNGMISDVKFSGQGCALSQAGASILTDLIKGEKVSFVQALKEGDFLDAVGIHPNPARLKCVLLSFVALEKALQSL